MKKVIILPIIFSLLFLSCGNPKLEKENKELKEKITELENQLRLQTHGCTMAYPQVIANLTNGQYAVVEGNDACRQNVATLAAHAIVLYLLGTTFPGRPNEFGNHL